jgi:hypothetical protein
MNINKTMLIVLAAVSLPGSAVLAQGSTNNPSTQEVFRVQFSATCQSLDSTRGRIVTTRLTDRNIIAQALGTNLKDGSVNRNFALAYNAAEDSLQVVNSNLQPVVDVVHFGGGAAIADNRQIDRFAFMFLPGQTNEFGAETNVFGSAVITERSNRVGQAGTSLRPNITGRLQFFLTDGNVLGATNRFTVMGSTNAGAMTNLISGTNGALGVLTTTNGASFTTTGLSGSGFVMTNSNIVFDASATICVGTFTTVPRTGLLTAPVFNGGITNGLGATNNISTTNTTTGVTNTNTGNTNTIIGTTNTPGAANTATGTAIGFNTTTGNIIGMGSSTSNIGFGSTGSVTPGVAGINPIGAVSPITGIANTVSTTGTIGTTAVGTPAGATIGVTR